MTEISQQPRMGQAKPGSQNPICISYMVNRDPTALSHHLLAPGSASAGSQNGEQRWDLEPKYSDWDTGTPGNIFNTMPNVCPEQILLIQLKISIPFNTEIHYGVVAV